MSSIKGADHKSNLNRLKRIEGQIQGITRMIQDQKYCINILTQIKAARSALRSLENNILENHLGNCLKSALKAGTEKEIEKKIEEVMVLLKQSGKS
jgi:DNA-binding FrmR family transcriptional regulator